MTPPRVPSEAELFAWFDSLSNWQRFGADDELGTLNLIDDAKRAEAARLIRVGNAVSCAWEIDPHPAADHVFGSPERTMRGTGENLPEVPRYAGASERIGFVFHGYAITHLDSLAHYFWDGRMYGGRGAGVRRARAMRCCCAPATAGRSACSGQTACKRSAAPAGTPRVCHGCGRATSR